MSIKNFACKNTEKAFRGKPLGKKCGWANVRKVAVRKLDMLNAAVKLLDLKSPPNNKLEALKDDLAGMHAVRVNDQWRLIFRWDAPDAYEVQIVDYH